MSVMKNLSMTSGVFVVVVFALSLVSAQNDFGLSSQSDLEPLDEIQELLEKVQTLYQEKIATKVQQDVVLNEEVEEKVVVGDAKNEKSSCACALLACTCCSRIYVAKLGINNNYCLSLKFSPKTNSIWTTLKIDWQVVINTDIAVWNPRTICVPIKCRMPGIKICLQFWGVKVVSGWATGCSRILVYCPGGLVAIANLGCFRMHCIDTTRQVVEGPQMPAVTDTEQVNFNEIPMEDLSPAGYKNGRM